MKIVFNDSKSGKSFQKELEKGKEARLVGKKIGEQFEGALIGLDGYTLQITGGSSKDGFPMRPDIPGGRMVRPVIGTGAGVRGLKKGQKLKKTVVGNTVSADTAQLNAKIGSYGPKPLNELGFVPKEKPKGEKKEEKKA